MPENDQYQGSQAFNGLLAADEQVNANTGSLQLSVPLVHLAGVHDDIALRLNLIYSHGGGGVFGLPRNWSINLPFVIPNASLSWAGNCFVLDPEWAAEDGYRSGLKYWNEHGVAFQQVIPPQPLPSGQPGRFDFTLRDKQGQRHYFDATGKLLATADRFGNRVSYSYVDPLSGPRGNRLKTIVDSFGQTVSFGYDPGNKMVVTLPGGRTTTVIYTSDGVVRIQDCQSNLTSFEYAPFGSSQVLVEAHYPTGLHSSWRYRAMAYTNANGVAGAMPAVEDFYHRDDGQSGRVLEHTTYLYGQNTGQTYTGVTAGRRLSPAGDGLIDSNDPLFSYDVVTIKCDENGAWLAATTAYFNYLHALTRCELHLLPGSRTVGNGRRITNTYPTSLNLARIWNATKPLVTEYSEWSADTKAFVVTRRDEWAYDRFGSVTAASTYNRSERDPRLEVTSVYREVAWGGQMPETSQTLDGVTGETVLKTFGLTEDQTNVRSIASSTKPKGATAFQPWKTLESSFDACGREVQASMAWTDPSTAAGTGPTRATTRHQYAYDGASHCLTVVEVDDAGASWTMRFDTQFAELRLLTSTDPLGGSMSSEYDSLGRTIATVDAVGGRTRHLYQLAQHGGVNALTLVHASGYKTRHEFDAAGRSMRTLDSGNGPGGECTRVLEQLFFDCAGNVVRRIDRQQRVETSEYDALRRPVLHTDSLGNQTRYDYTPLTVATSMNGAPRSVAVSDGLGHPHRQKQIAWQAAGTSPARLITEATFDGRGHTLTSVRSHLAEGATGAETLSRASFAYNPDGREQKVLFESAGSGAASLTVTKTFDLLNNVVQTVRDVSYSDGRSFTHPGPTSVYDSLGRLVSTTNGLGASEAFTHDAAGNLTARTRPDGSTVRLSYTPDGLARSIAYGDTVETHAYDAERRLIEIGRNGASIRYDYNPDGSVRGVGYEGGLRQEHEYDDSGRLTLQIDPSGGQTRYTYNADGQIATKSYQGEECRYSYSDVNGHKAILTNVEVSGQRHLVQQFGYDAFDAPNAFTASDAGTGALLLDARRTFDANRRVAQVSFRDAAGSWSQSFAYDGLDQLVAEELLRAGISSRTAFTYDGNGNVLTRAAGPVGEKPSSQSFSYDVVDQLQGQGITYDRLGRLLDNNGATYAYDDCDRLLTVTAAGRGAVSYTYHPDGLLAARRSGEQLFYDTGVVNAIKSSDGAFTGVVLGPSGPLALCRHGGATTYLLSAFGSVVASVNGASASRYVYSGYGEPCQEGTGAGDSPFRWKNELFDQDCGLTYLRSRFYDPATMRFLTADTYSVANKYNFGFGDPINQFDPTGHYSSTGMVLDVAGGLIGLGSAIAAPFTGGSSLAVGAAVASGLLGLASGVAGVINDASRNGNRAASEASMILGIGALLCDAASAAISVMAWRQTASALNRTERSMRRALGRGIVYVGETHFEPEAEALFQRLLRLPSPLRGVSLEVPHRFWEGETTVANMHALVTSARLPPYYETIAATAQARGLPVLFHDARRGGMGFRNEVAANRIRTFIQDAEHGLGGDRRGLFVLGGAEHFFPNPGVNEMPYPAMQGLVEGTSRVFNVASLSA